jgi:hypothetical protein
MRRTKVIAMPGIWQLPNEAKLTVFTIGAQLAIRAGLSAGLSLALATALYMKHPLYAMIAAIIVTDLSPSRSRHLGLASDRGNGHWVRMWRFVDFAAAFCFMGRWTGRRCGNAHLPSLARPRWREDRGVRFHDHRGRSQ